MGRTGAGSDSGDRHLADRGHGFCAGAAVSGCVPGFFQAAPGPGFGIPGPVHGPGSHGGYREHRRGGRGHCHRRAGGGVLDVGQRVLWNGREICRECSGSPLPGTGRTGGAHVHHPQRTGGAVAPSGGAVLPVRDHCCLWCGKRGTGQCSGHVTKVHRGEPGVCDRDGVPAGVGGRMDGHGWRKSHYRGGRDAGAGGQRCLYPAVSGGADFGQAAAGHGLWSHFSGRI